MSAIRVRTYSIGLTSKATSASEVRRCRSFGQLPGRIGSAGAGRLLARERANEHGRATTRPHRYGRIFLGWLANAASHPAAPGPFSTLFYLPNRSASRAPAPKSSPTARSQKSAALARVFSPTVPRFTSETDPLAEREGFEHSVPRKGTTFFWQESFSAVVGGCEIPGDCADVNKKRQSRPCTSLRIAA
jgi:hypothetical protein